MGNRLIDAALARVRRNSADQQTQRELDFDLATAGSEDREIVQRALPHTMTGVARLLALIDAVRYCARREIPGAFAECGVWRGGSVLAMILTLQDLGMEDREIYLYDTFDGMTAPTEHDVSPVEPPALETWNSATRAEEEPWGGAFAGSSFDATSVRETITSTGYPEELLHFVVGPVEETIPVHVPERIALLRLDTDWYESTRHELHHLYPRLADHGVLIVDDYGHWEGCRKAVDEYFDQQGADLLLNRIDYSGRIAVKQ